MPDVLSARPASGTANDDGTANVDVVSAEQFAALWDQLHAQMPPRLVEVAYHAALVHRFDLLMLRTLLPDNQAVASDVDRLLELGLAIAQAPASGAVQPSLRAVMLRRWRTDDLPGYQRASGAAADYFAVLMQASSFHAAQAPDAAELEYIYHLLGAGDPQAVPALLGACERLLAEHRPGTVERLLDEADEQAPVLPPARCAWLTYIRARLAQAYQHPDAAKALLDQMTTAGAEPALRAAALLAAGELAAAAWDWDGALTHFTMAQEIWNAAGDQAGVARALTARGRAYADLAASLGGLSDPMPRLMPRTARWVYCMLQAPFLFYRWFARRIDWLPPLYYSGDYQDWLIGRLLGRAIHCLEQAAAIYQNAGMGLRGTPTTQWIDVQVWLADLYHVIGKWSLGSRRLDAVTALPTVQASEFRWAVTMLERGRFALAQGRLDLAANCARAANNVFAVYGDLNAVTKACLLAGDIALSSGAEPAAVDYYAAGLRTAAAANDLLAATNFYALLVQIRQHRPSSAAAAAAADALANAQFDRRVYITRFPGTWLHRFRNLAAYVVIPTTYLVALITLLPALGVMLQVELLPQVDTGPAGDLVRGQQSLWQSRLPYYGSTNFSILSLAP